jgi:hypothetical protein
MYSWRRDAWSDMRARAGHKHDSGVIYLYTDHVKTEFDLTAFCLQDGGFSVQEI